MGGGEKIHISVETTIMNCVIDTYWKKEHKHVIYKNWRERIYYSRKLKKKERVVLSYYCYYQGTIKEKTSPILTGQATIYKQRANPALFQH